MLKTSSLVVALFGMGLQACDQRTPEQRLAVLYLPPPGFVADPDEGRGLYREYCRGCHGPLAAGSDRGPPLVHQTYRPGLHASQVFHFAVRDGVRQHHWRFGDMPAQPQVSPEQAAHITAHVRKLQLAAGIR